MMHEDDLLRDAGEMDVLAEINVVPFIDIMLVLLIIFMVTAPLMLGGVNVNLPRGGIAAMTRRDTPVIVSLDAQSRVFVGEREVAPDAKAALFRDLAASSANGEVLVRGDGEVKYKLMIELMGELGRSGFTKVILVTDLNAGQSRTFPGTME